MTDRRRINGPSGGTEAAVYADKLTVITQAQRLRKPNELRKIFLQTGLIPSAAGSAYLELEVPAQKRSFIPNSSTLKLSCSVNGPKPVDRNASFSPNLQVTASIKFAPFATRRRRGYVRDNIERDLGSHLENALKGVIILDRWPKSAVDISVIVLEGEEDCLWTEETGQEKGISGVGLMNVLAGSITVSAAALAHAKIDCLDMISGGVAARVAGQPDEILDPCPSEHSELSSACVVGYLQSRDEVAEVWSKSSAGDAGIASCESLIDAAIRAARGTHKVLSEVVLESVQQPLDLQSLKNNTKDVEMKT